MNLQLLIHNFSLFLSVQKQRSNHTVSNYTRDVRQFFLLTKKTSPVTINETVIHDYLHSLHQKK